MVDKGKEGQRQGVAFRRKSWKQLKKKTGSKKSHSIHTPLFPSYKHKNEDHSFVDNNLDVNYGEGRWQNLPLGFQTTLVIPATEYPIEDHFTLEQMRRDILYFSWSLFYELLVQYTYQ